MVTTKSLKGISILPKLLPRTWFPGVDSEKDKDDPGTKGWLEGLELSLGDVEEEGVIEEESVFEGEALLEALLEAEEEAVVEAAGELDAGLEALLEATGVTDTVVLAEAAGARLLLGTK
jgi:hypothetical protein